MDIGKKFMKEILINKKEILTGGDTMIKIKIFQIEIALRKIIKKNWIYKWWIYYWSKENVWGKDKDSQKMKWMGRMNIFWGIYDLCKKDLINYL